MEHEKFSSLAALYQRVLPALKTRKHEFHQKKLYFIQEIDIWEAIRASKWNNTFDLNLAEMVDDILNIDEALILEYMRLKAEQ